MNLSTQNGKYISKCHIFFEMLVRTFAYYGLEDLRNRFCHLFEYICDFKYR